MLSLDSNGRTGSTPLIVTGTTEICMIIGHPIRQVKSPGFFNRSFSEHGCDTVMVPIDIAPARLETFLTALRGWYNAAGCVVTVPHKRSVVAHLDGLTDRAQRLQAVNVIRRDAEGGLLGDNVDGLGFALAATAHGFKTQGAAAFVVGGGGVGSAIADSLCEAGLARLVLTDRDLVGANWLAGRLATAFPKVAISVVETIERLETFDLVVNATPVGMNGDPSLPLPPLLLKTLRPTTLVADVVTEPAMTPFLLHAQQQGCRVQTGPEMALAQMRALGQFMRVVQ